MRNVFLSFVFILVFGLIVSACSPNEQNKATNSGEAIEKSKVETKSLAEILPVLAQESDERYYKNGILELNLLPAEVGIGEHEPLLKALFPNGVITIADATELIDAFNIEYEGKKYSVALTYGSAQDASFVLDKIYVFEEEFTLDLLNEIL